MNHGVWSGIIRHDSGVCEMVRFRYALALIVSVTAAFHAAAHPVAAQAPEKTPVIAPSPLLTEPKTPEETFAALLLTVDLARMDLASKYLDQFIAADPNDELLIKLRNKYGTADFLKLAQSKELQPRSGELLERLNLAARKQVDDPAYIEGLIQRLTQGSAKRELAMIELRNAGPRVVPAILNRMSKPEMLGEQDTLVIALTKLGKQAIPPLIGALDVPEERIRMAVINTLGWLDATDAIPYLWFPAFDEHQSGGVHAAAKKTLAKLLKGSPTRTGELSPVEASNELRRLAKLTYRKLDLLPVDEQGNVNLWGWDDASNMLVLRTYPPEIASLLVSIRFGRQALDLAPDQPEPQKQYLASLLGLEVARDGWDKARIANPGSVLYLAQTAGESMVSQVLAEALEAGQPMTAVPALEVLSQIGTLEQLSSPVGLKSPVIAALNSPDPRVQFAAATTILKLEPKNSFNGATRIVGILARALTDPGLPRAIIIDADATRASETAGFVSEGGYEAIVTPTGRDGFERSATLAGVQLIVVHVNCMRWDLGQPLANLRADARTAAIPIVIYGPANLQDEMARSVARHAPATFISDSPSSNDFLGQLMPFSKSLKTSPLSPLERDLEKKAAVYWLATIGTGSLSKLFDISKAEKEIASVLEDPDVGANAIVALAAIGTASVQERLVDVALNPQSNDSLREVAAGQLAYHIQHHGLMLSRDAVINVHEGWKRASKPGVKSALASVIGSLKPTPAIVGERLLQFPIPASN